MTNIKPFFVVVLKDNFQAIHIKIWIVMTIIYVALILFCEIVVNNEIIDKIILVSIPINFKFFLMFFHSIVILEFVICLPKIFIDTINKNRIVFYLSNAISRYRFINLQIYSMIMLGIIGIILTYLFLILSIYIKTGIFIYEMYILISGLSMLFQIIGVYLIVIWSAIKYNSYAFSVTIVFVYSLFTGVLSIRERFAPIIEFDYKILNTIVEIIYLITPQIAELNTVLYIKNNFGFENIISIIVSFIPIWLLSLYEFNKKQF